MELVTMHTHTNYTGHGHGTVAELVNAAAATGISAIAVTEHYPMSEAMDPTNEVSMPWDKMPQYLIDIAAAAAAHPAMDVLPGCEVDWLGAQEDRGISALDFSNFVHVLGSVHYLDGWAFDDPAQEARWHDVGVDAVWRRYFEVWCEAASCREAPFTCMAHPDLVKKFGYRPSFNPQPLYDQAAEAVVAGGHMVEVNTSGLTYVAPSCFPRLTCCARFSARASRAPSAPTRTTRPWWRATSCRACAPCTTQGTVA